MAFKEYYHRKNTLLQLKISFSKPRVHELIDDLFIHRSNPPIWNLTAHNVFLLKTSLLCKVQCDIRMTSSYGIVQNFHLFGDVSFQDVFWKINIGSVDIDFTALTHFSPMFHFYKSWKRQKNEGFLTFSGDPEMEHWDKMG